MANTEQDLDFWQFISCARCRMPFSLESNSTTVPFWLTECGHIFCNNHLNSDQSCAQCGSQGIQLAPLQRQMEAPMSEWFQSVPLGLDSIAYAAKFQQEIMASQVRYHRSRHQQLRQLLERVKREAAELKNDNDALRHENDQYRLQLGQSNDYQTSDNLNPNRKRPMLSAQQFDYAGQRPKTGSSPHLVPTPSGPQRLTLQPGQHLAELSSHRQHEPEQSMTNIPYPPLRPESARSLERYAYAPQENNVVPSKLSYTQIAPREFQRTDAAQRQASQSQERRPPPSARFKPAMASYAPLPKKSTNAPAPGHTVMGPPPTPQHIRNETMGMSNRAFGGQTSNHHSLSNNQPAIFSSHRQTAIPATLIAGQGISGVASRRFFQPGGQSRASNALLPAEGQRTPFVSRSGQQEAFS